MNLNCLISRNIRFYYRYYRLMALAVIVAVMVIVGSLAVGDSVRQTLINRVSERLGDTETVIFSASSFIDDSYAPDGVLVSDGFVKTSERLLPVMVWGRADVARGTAQMNSKLTGEFNSGEIVLRLPATGLVPSGSLFVTDNYTTSLRLANSGVRDVEDGGNISLKNEQTIPLNIFVNRQELAEAMDVEGRINIILRDSITSIKDWTPNVSGLRLKEGAVTSDRIFIQGEVVDEIMRVNPRANRLFSYLVNSIGDIPYSFVTAMDRYDDCELSGSDIILSDYVARRMGSKTGDTVRMTYFVSENLKTLSTDTVTFIVRKIVPLSVLAQDSTLSAQFPGLSNVESCTDWDSDLPIDMDLITKEDELYWELYKTTPKAIVAYGAVAEKWSNNYGSATAIRGVESTGELTPEMFGVHVVYPREEGLRAARSGVDFSGLFLSLGFFIVVAALLLISLPIGQMLQKRRAEIRVLSSIGFSQSRIKGIIIRESLPVIVVSALIGVVAAFAYTACVLGLLGTLWQGATNTDGFTLSVNFSNVTIGFISALALSVVMLLVNIKPFKEGETKVQKKVSTKMRIILLALLIKFVVFSIFFSNFILAGAFVLITAVVLFDFIVVKLGASGKVSGHKIIWAGLYYSRSNVMVSLLTLALGVFTVFSVGLNRPVFDHAVTGTGGYDLWCENSVPIYHNLSTSEGREKMSLADLGDSVKILQIMRHGADDASCLNLNQTTQPTVLGLDMETLTGSKFDFTETIEGVNREELFRMLSQPCDSLIPVVADATVLTWGLYKSVGDTLSYNSSDGRTMSLKIVGALRNSIFQGNVLMNTRNFRKIWNETSGSERMLVQTDNPEKTSQLLQRAMSDYGVTVTPATERLREFGRVTDTYLTIFMILGSLGLMLGVIAFVVVVRKNLLMRVKEIETYRHLGFQDAEIKNILIFESVVVPLYAILAGVVAAIVCAIGSFKVISMGVWLTAFVFFVGLAFSAFLFIKESVRGFVTQK